MQRGHLFLTYFARPTIRSASSQRCDDLRGGRVGLYCRGNARLHAGAGIVDQGVVVYQLQRTAVGQRQMPVDAAQTGKFQRQHRPDALAAGQQTVPDGLVQPLLDGAEQKVVKLMKGPDGAPIESDFLSEE